MQSYSKGSVDPIIPVYYNGLGDASMQGYGKGTLRPFITVHYIG
jgi:hypothetical protein